MTEVQQARFDGWAIVDVLGHQRYVGYVTTEAYGGAVLFRIDVPALEARERVTKQPGYLSERGYCPAGTTVTEGAVDGYTKLIGAGSIYAITPCTKEAALAALEQAQPRPLMNAVLPPGRRLSTQTFSEWMDNEGDDDELEGDDDELEGGDDMDQEREIREEKEGEPQPGTSAPDATGDSAPETTTETTAPEAAE